MEGRIKQEPMYKLEVYLTKEELSHMKDLVRDGFDPDKWAPGSLMKTFASEFKDTIKSALE